MFMLIIKRGIIAVLFLVGLFAIYEFLTGFVKGYKNAGKADSANPLTQQNTSRHNR